MIVVDASVVVATLLTERMGREAAEILSGRELLHAPVLLPYEVANSIGASKGHGRLVENGARVAISQFLQIPWVFDTQVSETRLVAMLALVKKHKLTAYDASYLELAMHTGCPLASFDKALRAACASEGIAVLPAKLS